MTNAGPLDLLGTIGHGHSYEDLIDDAIELQAGEALHIRVLKLERLIEVKQETATEKDKVALFVLRQTLHERTK